MNLYLVLISLIISSLSICKFFILLLFSRFFSTSSWDKLLEKNISLINLIEYIIFWLSLILFMNSSIFFLKFSFSSCSKPILFICKLCKSISINKSLSFSLELKLLFSKSSTSSISSLTSSSKNSLKPLTAVL